MNRVFMARWAAVSRALLPWAVALTVAVVVALLTRGLVWDGLALVPVSEVTR